MEGRERDEGEGAVGLEWRGGGGGGRHEDGERGCIYSDARKRKSPLRSTVNGI